MQCGCPVCGAWMGQVMKGLDSRCVCPQCGYFCSACMGTDSVQPKGHYTMPESFAQLVEESEALSAPGVHLPEGENDLDSAMDKAWGYLSAQDRTAAQMESYLYGKGFAPETVEEAVNKLKGYGYIDDGAYASKYVRELSSARHLGRLAMRQKLSARGVEKEAAQAALDAYTEEEEWGKRPVLGEKAGANACGQGGRPGAARPAGAKARTKGIFLSAGAARGRSGAGQRGRMGRRNATMTPGVRHSRAGL